MDEEGETLVPMSEERRGGCVRFTCELVPSMPEILWYSFEVRHADGNVSYYCSRDGRTGGEGVLSDKPGSSFQVTVYRERATKPDWYKNGIVYQIFPDRYRRGSDWRELSAAALSEVRNGPERVLRQDWYATPVYLRDGEGQVLAWDFYGGTLSGIREKLDHLKEMGVTALYLNPIFEASSNHRYDTADYLRIDPMLGDEEAFKTLCSDAETRGISIILDGVFNHTGCDSRYFNKYGNYPEVGAYQSEDSPYRSWYKISDDGKSYCSWWGVGDLPDVNEDEPTYIDFIYGKPNGVVRRWLQDGARGWRLDVADELPEDFIAGIKDAVLDTKPDGLLLGEVWEDASNKISYGQLRHYLLGNELDSAMNYPLRDALLPFLTGDLSASDVAERLESLHENYPSEAFYSTLNLLGSHDRPRLLTVLGDAPGADTMSEEERGEYRLNPGSRGLAKGRLWLATLLQMTLPGVPCIYYGDDAGLEGYADPYNRAGYPWGREDQDTLAIYRNAIALRKEYPFFVDGDFETMSFGDDVFGFTRMGKKEGATVLVNRSLTNSRDVAIPLRGEDATEIISGAWIEKRDGQAFFNLRPLGSAVVYHHDKKRLAAKLDRGSGVLCHITSLPATKGPGTMGGSARRFVDFLEEAHQSYWQVLPVNPTDAFGSPYAGISAFAGNVRLIDTDGKPLRDLFPGDTRLYDIESKKALHGIISSFTGDEGYRAFCEKNAWLRPYATFMAIRDEVGEGILWQDWPDEYRTYVPELAERHELKNNVAFHEWSQYEFQRQWDELHAYANAHGIKIIGDMPMYVSADSASVWSQPEMFRLNDEGRVSLQAGTPPDAFAVNGQLWGNPTYDWDAMRRTGYQWWVNRLRRAFDLYDYVRLDHFLGFEHYYAIPEGKTAAEGSWLPGPGIELFKAVSEQLGELPVIAEDLGTITPGVRALVAETGCPGMDVLEFNDGDVRQGYQSAPGKIAYTSTHDTATLLGWCRQRFGSEGNEGVARDLLSKVMASNADVVIFPLQDVLGLGDESRMNVPGVAQGNWSWQVEESQFGDAVTWFAKATDEAGRS